MQHVPTPASSPPSPVPVIAGGGSSQCTRSIHLKIETQASLGWNYKHSMRCIIHLVTSSRPAPRSSPYHRPDPSLGFIAVVPEIPLARISPPQAKKSAVQNAALQ